MSRKNTKSNPVLTDLIHNLKKQANEKNVNIWKDIAKRLEKPSRNWPEVNLFKISKNVNEKETALIPGKVLSTGDLDKKITVAAWSFSEQAEEKIKKAGGKSISIQELLEKNPDGKNIRILG